MALPEEDLGQTVLQSGGPNNYLSKTITSPTTLPLAPQIQKSCLTHLSTTTPTPHNHPLLTAATTSLHAANLRLDELRLRIQTLLNEHHTRLNQLSALQSAFSELSAARAETRAVSACRSVADAYVRALRPLTRQDGAPDREQMAGIAEGIRDLVAHVAHVRRMAANVPFVGEGANERILKSVENRAVDAVIKARAVFVNVLDNEFRRFGWPMAVPVPGKDDDVIRAVDFYVRLLARLQRVAAEGGDYVPHRTKWHCSLSDSWAVAAILRAPLARFKYHFLETFRADGRAVESAGTARFDRPEWAAEFAMERVKEATPFLERVGIEGDVTAEVKFAEGFCRVFADKIAYDCELALRTSTNDADADVLIAHASETAKQFDARLREGVVGNGKHAKHDEYKPAFVSSLHVLSMNESFLTTWASSELRLADAEVNRLLTRALCVVEVNGVDDGFMGEQETPVASREDLELLCNEIVDHVGNASQKSRSLECKERISTFLKLTELPLLQSMRARLKEEVDIVDEISPTADQIVRSGRASFCAQLISDALEDRAVDHFYLTQENLLNRGFYDDEISRLRALHSSNSSLLTEAITTHFTDSVKTGYMDQARFGEISAPDAAVVLTHDLSEALVNPLTSLESCLAAVKRAVPCRKAASTIWRPVASRLDRFFFDDIVLQCFAGGSRNAMAVASATNSYLAPTSCARMARQLAFDAATFVSTFSVVSTSPEQFLPSSAECSKLLSIASSRVLLPSVPLKPGDQEVIEALRSIVESDEDNVVNAAGDVLQSRIGTCHIAPREALELLAIGGLRFAIRMM